MFQMTFVKIPEFDWLPRQKKGVCFFLMLKHLLRNHNLDEADAQFTYLFMTLAST